MKVKIIIEPTFSNNWPNLRLEINQEEMFNGFCKPNKENYFVWYEDVSNLLEENILKITHYNKKGQDTIVDDEGNIQKDRSIILKSIEFDNMSVPDVILYDQKFYPDWPGQPTYIKNNLYFGYNGTYVFKFQKNSKIMYYQNLIQKEMLANINNKKILTLPSGEQIESFEFNGKFVDSAKKDSVTIDDLYQAVTNEN